MPIYEFECRSCHRKTTSLVLSRDRIGEVRCKHCGGADLERLWSRFASPKSEEARLDSMADPSCSCRPRRKRSAQRGQVHEAHGH